MTMNNLGHPILGLRKELYDMKPKAPLEEGIASYAGSAAYPRLTNDLKNLH